MDDIKVGQRLAYGSNLCTVRYIGQIEGTVGTWYGVEWDVANRGKHSGQHNGVRYFDCKKLNAGSFVRPNRPYEKSVSFLEALQKKYVYNIDQNATPIEFGSKVAQEIGFDKVSRQIAEVKKLSLVILDGCAIDRFDDTTAQLEEMCSNVQELDVSRNLITSLKTIAEICAPLPNLRDLKLNGNRLGNFDLPERLNTAFDKIRSLGLEDQGLSWDELLQLISHFPNLEAISLGLNNLKILTPSSQTLPVSLKTISLEENEFTALSDLFPLQLLPNLTRLELKLNKISVTDSTSPSSDKMVLYNLNYLDVSSNEIADWSFINDLQNVVPNLEAIRLSRNPLYLDVDDKKAEELYMLTVGRLSDNITTINYGKISVSERLNAELYYLSKIKNELEEGPPEQEDTILMRHPRWNKLQEYHGHQNIIRRFKDESRRTLASTLIELQFIHDSRTITKKVPRSVTISGLKAFVGKLYGLKPLHINLIATGNVDDPMDDEFREISFYVDNLGAKVFVHDVDASRI